MKQAVLGTVMAAAIAVGVLAQGAATTALPLDNLGVEHLDIIVPDPAASARFYSRIFKSALHQQPVRDTPACFHQRTSPTSCGSPTTTASSSRRRAVS